MTENTFGSFDCSYFNFCSQRSWEALGPSLISCWERTICKQESIWLVCYMYNISFQWGEIWCILFHYSMLSITWSFLSLYCIAICWFVSFGWNRITVHQNNTNKNNRMNGIDVFFDRQKCRCCGHWYVKLALIGFQAMVDLACFCFSQVCTL